MRKILTKTAILNSKPIVDFPVDRISSVYIYNIDDFDRRPLIKRKEKKEAEYISNRFTRDVLSARRG